MVSWKQNSLLLRPTLVMACYLLTACMANAKDTTFHQIEAGHQHLSKMKQTASNQISFNHGSLNQGPSNENADGNRALTQNDDYDAVLDDQGNDQSPTPQDHTTKDDTPKILEDMVDSMQAFAGIFTLYQDDDTGSLYMAINVSQLDKEYLYFASIHNGILEAYNRRGQPVAEDVIEIKRYFNRIDFVNKNTAYNIDVNDPLKNGGLANISDSVLASVEIAAISKDGTSFLINADTLFQTEALARITYNDGPDADPFEDFTLGELARDKAKYTYVGVYPENLNVRTDYVYQNTNPYVSGSERIADARSITVAVQHSFVSMPENDFVPRLADQRVGYFTSHQTDLSSYEFLPYNDLITRFHLVKKDPSAELSEPAEPIVWWIENTAPLEYRDIMKAGILAWNSAFEKAGFKNAIVVKQQPDDATWSAEDIRYNVVRYSNTPDAGSAFGPNFVNPRTGQVLGGDVMFEHSFLTAYAYRGDLLANPEAFIKNYVAGADRVHMNRKNLYCSKGIEMREMLNFGNIALSAMNASVSYKRKIIEQMLMELMLHEVGHVLGLSHNMKGSNLHKLEDINDNSVTKGILSSSIMDYTALNIAKPNDKQGYFFSVEPGPYDDWAIQFGYDPSMEGQKREAHLARSSEPELMFGNDADDMRSPGSGIDPRVNIWDMTSNAIAFAQYQFELLDEILPELKSKLSEPGESWAKVRAATQTMITYKRAPTETVASFIGGVEVSRFVQGQVSNAAPYKPLDKAAQQHAMKVLAKHVFAPNAFELPSELISYSAMQPRGFEHFGRTEDPKLHNLILQVQKRVFARLLNPIVMLRLSDTQLYGNTYSVTQMMAELSDAVFAADLKQAVNTQRQMLQHEYVAQLTQALNDDAVDSRAKASIFSQLTRIQAWMGKARSKDEATSAHRQYLAYLIKTALEKT